MNVCVSECVCTCVRVYVCMCVCLCACACACTHVLCGAVRNGVVYFRALEKTDRQKFSPNNEVVVRGLKTDRRLIVNTPIICSVYKAVRG